MRVAGQPYIAVPRLIKQGQDHPRAKWPGELAMDPDTLSAQWLQALAKKADGFTVNDLC